MIRSSSHAPGRPRGLVIGLALGAALGVLAFMRVRRRTDARRRRFEETIRARDGRLPRVVILGGGAGGLFCALALKDAPVETVVVDRADRVVYEALLYQVATGRLDDRDVSLPMREALGRVANASLLTAEADGIDLARHEVHLRAHPHSVLYDYLVIATGLEPDYFGHEEWARYARPLKTLEDAEELHRRISTSLEEAREQDGQSRPELSTVVLVGGGPTGVELAGALAEMPTDESSGDGEPSHRVRVVLVEALPRLLPAFSAETAEKVRARLEARGVEIRLGSPVEEIDAEGATVGGERIPSRNVVWAAGMRPTPLGRAAGLPTDDAGRIVTLPDLTVPEHPEVYAIGDGAHVEAGGRALPALAPVALEEAHYVARSLTHAVEGRPAARPFRYVDRGEIATVGRGWGVLEALDGRVKLRGLPAELAWIAGHVFLQVPPGDKMRMLSEYTRASLAARRRPSGS